MWTDDQCPSCGRRSLREVPEDEEGPHLSRWGGWADVVTDWGLVSVATTGFLECRACRQLIILHRGEEAA